MFTNRIRVQSGERLNVVIVQLFSQSLVLSRHSQFWSKIICFALLHPNVNDIFISYFTEVIIAQTNVGVNVVIQFMCLT